MHQKCKTHKLLQYFLLKSAEIEPDGLRPTGASSGGPEAARAILGEKLDVGCRNGVGGQKMQKSPKIAS